jgi:GT2 family glycosyltransferase
MTSVSVVVATRDRPDRLQALRESLPGGVEVVLVDDGSSAPVPGATIRHPEARGPTAARNAGWRAASGDLIAFTDDDCVVQPGWIEALSAAGEAHQGAFIQGRTEPDPREADRAGAFTRTQSVAALGPWYQTCNIAYPRDLLEGLGGFDEQFPFPAGEDTDLAWRALEAGAEAVFEPGAVVWHAVHELGPERLIAVSQRWATTVRNVRRHPGLREHLHRRVFWKPSHERLLLAALLVRRRPLLGAAAAAWWAAGHRGSHGSAAGTAAALPAHLAVDAAEVVAMARGSLRFRTFVL